MISKIVSISGKPGLHSLLSQGKNMLIVEDITTGKRQPVYSRDKVVSLADVSIYTLEGDVPLGEVFQKVSEKAGGEKVDVKALGNDEAVRAYFEEILPAFDKDRVYTTDIKKLFQWYNLLVGAGITDFVEKDEAEAPAEETAKPEDEKKAE